MTNPSNKYVFSNLNQNGEQKFDTNFVHIFASPTKKKCPPHIQILFFLLTSRNKFPQKMFDSWKFSVSNICWHPPPTKNVENCCLNICLNPQHCCLKNVWPPLGKVLLEEIHVCFHDFYTFIHIHDLCTFINFHVLFTFLNRWSAGWLTDNNATLWPIWKDEI